MMALLIVIWWIFQLTVIQTITAVFDLMSRYHDRHLSERLTNYRRRHPEMPFKYKGSFIEVTWFYDLVKRVIVPVAGIWSIPLCVYMAGGVFDLSSVVSDYFYKPFINIPKLISLSLFKLAVVVSLYFIFSYLNYSLKAFYRVIRTQSAIRKLDEGVIFKESDINFNLADNLISLICWGLFIIISFLMLKIPTTALTLIATGLATGFGFAMKDVLNNFFYGVQLMSGRLRVGDVIECDGIRGTVDNMSYQTTQIVAMDGSVIAFPNSTLFAKNFKNLTRNHSYEMLKIPVGVAYGSDVDKVREVITKALEPLQTRDKYGREVVDTKFGVVVRFAGFGESSVDLDVIQFTTVDAHYTYAAKAKELIYNALNENGIQIPFPQVDIHTDSKDTK
jgi:small-conductance mechanosensitive channel